MKITVLMIDPDTIYDAVQDAVAKEIKETVSDRDEAEALMEIRTEKMREKLGHWFRYGEYLSVTFDTEAMTATVNPATSI